MKLILINKFLYAKGGDAICALETGALLRQYGHEVAFWGMKHAEDPAYPHVDLFVGNMDLNNISGFKARLSIAGKLLYSYEAKSKIESFLSRTGKPNVVHLHNFAHQISPSILHVFKKYNIPVVMTMHDYKLVCASYTLLNQGKLCERCAGARHFNCFLQKCVKNSRVKSLLNTAEMYLHHSLLHMYDLVDVFISPSRFLKDKVAEMGFRGEVAHIPNFVDIREYSPQYDSSERSIVYVGRLSKEKGIATLIEAVKGIDVDLKIIGDGPMRDILEQGFRRNVSFLGYMSGEKLRKEIRRSLFVVVPSEWYENNPLSVIETFALGKPVIGARIGGIPELVKDGETGLTFTSGNTDDLRAKIMQLIADREAISRMGRTARAFVEKELNADTHYEKLMDVYQYAIDKHKRSRL